MDEMDLDAFIGFGDIVLDDEPADAEVVAAIAAAQRDIPAPPEEKPDNATFIAGVIFRSHESGPPHIVSVVDGGPMIGRYVACNCAAMRSLGHRPQGCWAMVFVRHLIGITLEGR